MTSTRDFFGKIRRGLKKPPKVIIKRIYQELVDIAERYLAPYRAKQLTLNRLLKKTRHNSLNAIWGSLSVRPFLALVEIVDQSVFAQFCPEETAIILNRAAAALKHEVNLLGSGPIELGQTIDWHKDYKTSCTWPRIYNKDIDYNNADKSSDVKFPWELSRLQWLIPAGQAYLFTQDEKYAVAVKQILLDWITNNPYAQGVNWACTMEVALRIVSWTWFFHVFKHSASWQEETFQQAFLTTLYLHADFTERHLEFSDINGNHYTADAAGLVFSGLFWGNGKDASRWLTRGWDILCQELPKQVFEDGVDFEASVPYHRLVLELFFLPARYRECFGLDTPTDYKNRLILMSQFSIAYSQPTQTVPNWGDADDARTLPLGNQRIDDHRYLCGLVGHQWGSLELLAQSSGPLGEHFWLLGIEATNTLKKVPVPPPPQSTAFPKGGFYIMQNVQDHIFIDCGPLGLAGRGGHGHNDCLSFEAVLCSEKLIVDPGAYVYTASYKDRNLFRSTAYHNTPCIDNQEINRFIRWDYLWTLHEDAKPKVEIWQPGKDCDFFQGSHDGYQRLPDPVIIKRGLTLFHAAHSLVVEDTILCKASHEASIPLHLATEVTVSQIDEYTLALKTNNQQFILSFESQTAWRLEINAGRASPSYGVVRPCQTLVWRALIKGDVQLKTTISPA